MHKHFPASLMTRIFSVILCISLLLSGTALAAAPAPSVYVTGGNSYELLQETVSFIPLTHKSYDTTFYYSDGFFTEAPETYSPRLASLAAGLSAAASYSDSRTAESVLTDLGFYVDEFYTNPNFSGGTSAADSIGFLLAHKTLYVPEERELLVVLIRGREYGMEWAGNFTLGNTGDAAGFTDAAQQIFDALYSSLPDIAGCSYFDACTSLYDAEANGTLDYYICGHSRAGSVAALLSKMIIDRERSERASDPNSVYCYALAPSATGTQEGSYPSIHNIVNSSDIVTLIPTACYGFHRYGVDHEISASVEDPAFLFRLGQIAPGEKFESDFSAAYLDLDLSEDIFTIAERLDGVDPKTLFVAYPEDEQVTMKEFLSDALGQLIGYWNPKRTDFTDRVFGDSKVHLESVIGDVLGIYFNMTDEQVDALRDVLSNLGNRLLKMKLLKYFDAVQCASDIPKWYKCNTSDREDDIEFLIYLLEGCEKNGHTLQNIFGSDYLTLKADFPVVADFVLENVSRDYQKYYDPNNPISTQPRAMYIIATVVYNIINNENSLIYPHLLGAYMAALQNEDSLYGTALFSVNDSPFCWLDDRSRWVLAKYNTAGRLISVTEITSANADCTLSTAENANWLLLHLDSENQPLEAAVTPKTLASYL